MRKALSTVLVFVLLLLAFPKRVYAADASFSISGPDSLRTGETGTYTVQVTVSDAVAAQATLQYNPLFFELVSGSVSGEWDSASNESRTVELISVMLKCVGPAGTSGTLSLSGKKAARLTGGDPPIESISCGGSSKKVGNPVLGLVPTPDAMPSATPESSPVPVGTPEPWAQAAYHLKQAQAGETIIAALPDAELPTGTLATLKEKQCSLKIVLGDYGCEIDGSGLCTAPDEAMNLGVSMKKDETLSAAARGRDVFQLHFAYSGELPGRFAYTFKAQGCGPGDVLYLYRYYPKAGAAECAQSAVVDAEGNVTLVFCHCSGYFVTKALLDEANSVCADRPAVQASAASVRGSVSLTVLIVCVAFAALLGATSAIWMVRLAVIRRKTHR